CHLPDLGDGKCGLDDYLVDHTVDDLFALVRPDPPIVAEEIPAPPPPPPVEPHRPKAATMDLATCHAVYQRWLGESYDTDALDAVLATAAGDRLDGDPVWLLMVAGAGGGKTETVASLAGAGAHVESTIASEAALLSGTPKHEQSKNSTGGLLRKLRRSGIL